MTAHRWVELETLLRRVRGEYREMLDLRLTRPQAERLLSLDGATCQTVFDILVAEGFLQESPDGSFRLADTGVPWRRANRNKRATGPEGGTS